MAYSSLIFIFYFLPFFLLFFFAVKGRARNFILLVASLLFYFWGEGGFVLFLGGSICFNYLMGLWIKRKIPRKKPLGVFLLALGINIGTLGFFKYTHFLMDNLNPTLTGIGLPPVSLSPIHLPIGISFITFQALSYIIDIYRQNTPVETNLLKFSVYLGSFPKLIMGPITPYHKLYPQLGERKISVEDLHRGIRRFVMGLGKKLLIADSLAPVANQVFAVPADQQTAGLAWLGIMGFTLQIYFDFSGYTDMAIGIGRMCGFTFLENFNYPYMARSIKDFWRRWHISLAKWLRDYLFLPIAYSVSRKIKSRRFMKIKAEDWAYFTGSFFTMTLCGLWHGASWTFVFWGSFYGVMLIVEHAWLGRRLKRLWGPLQVFYTQFLVVIAWVFFRSDGFHYALVYLKAMFGFGTGDGVVYYPALYIDGKVMVSMVAGVLLSTPLFSRLDQWCQKTIHLEKPVMKKRLSRVYRLIMDLGMVFIFVFAVMALAGGTYNPFIYFRF